MITVLKNWLDHRTGYRKFVDSMLLEGIPGGARWRYVWGSCLATVFFIQLFTGILLVSAYSPGASTAWASVYFIQYQMDFGWLIRGLHHFGSQAMVILLAIHMLQVVIAGAHLPPREVNWWLGLTLLGLVLGLSLTGYLLPWDQKGYWATTVATNIASNLPVVGPALQKFLVGGPEYGHHTLARFYTLHVALIPPLVIGLIIAHIVVFRRHGVTTPKRAEGQGWFWPDQAYRDIVIGLVILVILIGVVIWPHGHAIDTPAIDTPAVSGGGPSSVESPGLWERIKHAGRGGHGANLDAPADPARPYPARPEWYFLSMYQLLKYFEGDQEILGTVVIPAAIGAVLFIMPLLGYRKMRLFGHLVGVMIMIGLLGSVVTLTYQAVAEDRGDSEQARLFQSEFAKAEMAAQRAIQLADIGIPPAGPVELLRRDPLTRGEGLFGQHCATCHTYGTIHTQGDKASDLKGFGSYAWTRDLLRDPSDPRFFGRTKLKRMTRWVEKNLTDLDEQDEQDLDTIARWLSGHPRPTSSDAKTEAFKHGLELFEEFECTECHVYDQSKSKQKAPTLTDYGSADWIRGMVMAPDHPTRYGKGNIMPIFLDLEGPAAPIIRQHHEDSEIPLMHISDVDRELIIRWLTRDYRPVYGGDPITAPSMP